MHSYFEIDVNCPTCFNDVLDAVSSTAGVEHVDGHAADGCLSVTHHLDESVLRSLIAKVGRTIEIADNGEYVMGEATPSPRTHATGSDDDPSPSQSRDILEQHGSSDPVAERSIRRGWSYADRVRQAHGSGGSLRWQPSGTARYVVRHLLGSDPKQTTMTIAPHQPVAQRRPTWRAMAIPSEHGGWGLTAEPILLGLVVAFSWAGVAIGSLPSSRFSCEPP